MALFVNEVLNGSLLTSHPRVTFLSGMPHLQSLSVPQRYCRVPDLGCDVLVKCFLVSWFLASFFFKSTIGQGFVFLIGGFQALDKALLILSPKGREEQSTGA